MYINSSTGIPSFFSNTSKGTRVLLCLYLLTQLENEVNITLLLGPLLLLFPFMCFIVTVKDTTSWTYYPRNTNFTSCPIIADSSFCHIKAGFVVLLITFLLILFEACSISQKFLYSLSMLLSLPFALLTNALVK